MLRFTKRFAGSYVCTINTIDIDVQSYAQYSALDDQDYEGNKWVVTFSNDFDGDFQGRFKTKKEAIAYANRVYAIAIRMIEIS